MYQLSRSKRDVQLFFSETSKQREISEDYKVPELVLQKPIYPSVIKVSSSLPIVEKSPGVVKEESQPVIKDSYSTVEEAPAPVVETPVVETPVEQPPVEETPVETPIESPVAVAESPVAVTEAPSVDTTPPTIEEKPTPIPETKGGKRGLRMAQFNP